MLTKARVVSHTMNLLVLEEKKNLFGIWWRKNRTHKLLPVARYVSRCPAPRFLSRDGIKVDFFKKRKMEGTGLDVSLFLMKDETLRAMRSAG